MKGVAPLIEGIPFDALLADKAFDADWLRAEIGDRGVTVVIPPKSNRKDPRDFDKHIYRWAVLDNRSIFFPTHCLGCDNRRFGSGVLKRHSHSFRNGPKCLRGTPLNLRLCCAGPVPEVPDPVNVISGADKAPGMGILTRDDTGVNLSAPLDEPEHRDVPGSATPAVTLPNAHRSRSRSPGPTAEPRQVPGT